MLLLCFCIIHFSIFLHSIRFVFFVKSISCKFFTNLFECKKKKHTTKSSQSLLNTRTNWKLLHYVRPLNISIMMNNTFSLAYSVILWAQQLEFLYNCIVFHVNFNTCNYNTVYYVSIIIFYCIRLNFLLRFLSLDKTGE